MKSLILLACLVAIAAAKPSGHALVVAGHGWGGYGHGHNQWGDVGPSGVVTGHGASGPSGVVTGHGTAGPAGRVNGHGAVGPSGEYNGAGWGAWGPWGHGLGLGYGHGGVVVAGPVAHGAVIASPGYGWGGHGYGHWW